MKDCPKCGKPVADSALFCGSCGATMPKTSQKPAPAKGKAANKNLCPNCGKPRSESGKFCLGCGTPLDPDALSGIRTVPVSPQKGGFLRFLCGILCVIMFITMIGNAISSPVVSNKEKITITVWAAKDDQLEGNNWLVDRQTQFAAQHPEYEITWVNEVCGESDAVSRITKQDGCPDVYMFMHDQLSKLVDANALTPLSSYYTNLIRSGNSDLAENSVTYSGRMYGFPMESNSWFLYYDKTVFNEKDVKSLDDMLAKGKVYLPLRNPWTGGCFFLGTGCTILGDNGTDETAGFDFDGSKAYDAAKKMLGVVKNENTVTGDLDISKMIDREVSATFSGAWVYNDLKAAYGNDLGIAPLPTFTYNGETYQMTAMSGTRCVVGVNPATVDGSPKQTLCVDFASFLASEESQIARYEVNGRVPVSSSVLTDSRLANDELVKAELYTMENSSVLQPCLSRMENYWGPMYTFLGDLVDGRITVQNYKIAVDQLNEDLNA